MSYKCAIFGHRYGETEVDRDREEDGSEVITVERETQTCARCEHVRVVSENKEVKTVETAADIVADDLADDNATETEHTGDTTASPEPVEARSESTSIAETVEQPRDPAEEDAVILDDDEDEDEREPGEWPKEPSAEDESSGVETEDPAVGDDDGSASWELPSDIDPHPETDQPSVEPSQTALTVPEGEFYCPKCEFTTAVESSSLRAGDYCPECHIGTLEHRSE